MIEREVLGADLVECADDAALEDRPEALDRVGVDRADDILAARVRDDVMRIILIRPAIADP
jgi:hypothetical protein